MARIEWIDQRLQRWAEWLKVGNGAGYPVRCVLDEDWSPPAPGTTPTMKVAPMNDAPQTHRAVLQLSERLQATLVSHYLLRMSAADAAAALSCEPNTVHQRIERAHELLARAVGGVFATTTN